MSIEDFKKDISDTYKDTLVDVVRKYLINGSSYFFELETITDNEYNIKSELSNILNIHSNNILIVGSAKLGFSIKPNREDRSCYEFKSFRFDYDSVNEIEESDIDIAIIDENLFETKLQTIYKHLRGYDLPIILENFHDCRKSRQKYKKCFDDFSRYILLGWLRPDKMPKDFELSPELEDVRNKYNKLYNRSINIGIYKSWFYFEEYNIQNLKNIQQAIKIEEIRR